MLDGSELDGPPPLRRASSAAVEPSTHHHRLTRRASLDDLEQNACELAPKIENRIIVLDKPEVSLVSKYLIDEFLLYCS
ncbi:hypothetical protein RR48_00345 [Papilio machaon]|uniref:Uncharacterized protein n=1 Tax=Papilio machaon TaxID=76193 RepID=A0A0N1IKS4_PAPMA|nr:hypothetical protein RR48_00345 [Papilio machaon]